MGGAGGDILGPANLHQGLGRMAQRTSGIHHVIQKDDPFVFHIADDVHNLRGIGLLPPLVHDSQGHIQLLGEGTGTGHGAHVGGDYHGVLPVILEFAVKVVHKDGGAQQIIHWDIKKALNLVGMEVHRQNPVRAGGGNQVGHQLGRNGIAGFGLPILTGVAEIGNHCGNPSGGGPFQGINDNEQLHQGVVDCTGLAVLDKGAGGLHHKYIGAPNRLIDGGKVFPIGKSAHL